MTVWPERKQEGGDEKIIKQERKEDVINFLIFPLYRYHPYSQSIYNQIAYYLEPGYDDGLMTMIMAPFWSGRADDFHWLDTMVTEGSRSPYQAATAEALLPVGIPKAEWSCRWALDHHHDFRWLEEKEVNRCKPFLHFMMIYGSIMDLYGSIWIYMDLYGSIWIYMDLCGSIWIYMDLYGSIWIYMDLYGSIWIYMDLYGSIWIYMDQWVYVVQEVKMLGFAYVLAPGHQAGLLQ